MSDAAPLLKPWTAALDRRAALLARLIESHPARHLLAEYEAVFLDRHRCLDRFANDEAAAANDLLARMNAAITSLREGPQTMTRRDSRSTQVVSREVV